jgi:hypothetical protein
MVRKQCRTTALKRIRRAEVTARRFRHHGVEDIGGCFVVKASNDRPLLGVKQHYRDRPKTPSSKT